MKGNQIDSRTETLEMATILLIDDDERLRRMVGRMLAGAGHQVIEAENGRAALASLPNCHPDLVITDVFMPEKDGIETTKEIRAMLPDIKILAMTGGGRGDRFYALIERLATVGVLQKPFDQTTLLDSVSRLLAGG
jgi:CheY-like chemotaxis protein